MNSFLIKMLTLCFLCFLLSMKSHAENTSSFYWGGGLRVDYKLKDGIDPIKPFEFRPYLVSNHHADIGVHLGYDLEWSSLEFKNRFEFYKDLISLPPVQFFSKKILSLYDDVEHSEISYGETKFVSSLFFKPFKFLKFGLQGSFVLKQYHYIFPDYLESEGGGSNDQIKEFSLSPKVSVRFPVGELETVLFFEEKTETLEKKISRNFNFGEDFFLSYGVFYYSPKLIKKIFCFGGGFQYQKKIREEKFSDTKEYAWNAFLDVYITRYLDLYLKYKKLSIKHTFDSESAHWVEASARLYWKKAHDIFLTYRYLHSDFGDFEEFSYKAHVVEFSYSFRVNYNF